ncbi:MAG: hypothetical protein FWE12_01685 [Oscillospiraceae bacterium]|nr:hypothetical protein [Oscillospiraceae bacterium]
MRKRLIVLLLALVLLTSGGAMAISWVTVQSIDQLADVATYVVRVEVLDGREVRVLEVFSGEIRPGDTIEIRQVGGNFWDRWRLRRTWDVPELPLVRGDDLVLFLFRMGDSPRAGLLNPWQGAYRFPNSNESTLTVDLPRVLENAIRPGLRLTIGDLLEIAEANFGDEPREVLAHSGARPRNPAI